MWPVLKFFFVILHILALPLYMILGIICAVYKGIVHLSASVFQDFIEPITSADSLFLADHIFSRPHSSVVVAVELNGSPSEKDVAQLFQNVYDLKDSAGRRSYRELGYSLVSYYGHGFWKEVPNFEISDRIHLLNPSEKMRGEKTETGFSTASEVPITSIMEGLMRKGYEKGQPLWEVYIVPNCNGDLKDTMLIIRFHHLMADGMSFVKLFFALTGSNTLPTNFTKPSSSMQKWDLLRSSFLEKIYTATALATVGFVDYLHQLLFDKNRHSLHYSESGKLKITGNWIVSLGKKLNLADIKRFSKNSRCSIVHVVLCGLSSALERYFHKYHSDSLKYPVPREVHFAVPFPIPNHPNLRLVNRWCLGKLNVKFGIESIVDKLTHFQEEAKRCASATFTTMTAFTFQFACGFLPSFLVDAVSKSKAAFTLTVSNIVGPQENELLANSPVVDMFFFMPIAQESMALTAGIISCNGGIRIGLTADTGCVPDKSRLDDLGLMIFEEITDMCSDRNDNDTLVNNKI